MWSRTGHDAVADFFIPLEADPKQEAQTNAKRGAARVVQVTTRFRTRAFLICFIPFALLLASSFWMIQRFVQSTVRDGLHTSLRESQAAIANIHAKGDLQNSRFLKIAGENSALKAGMQLLLANQHSDEARRTVEDQLRELGEHMGFDFMLVSAPDGSPLAGVVRSGCGALGHAGQLVPLDVSLSIAIMRDFCF